MSKKNSSLPPLFAGWVEELLEGEIPDETRATCSDCAMQKPADAREGDRETYFDPLTKCCTYVPFLPNFLIGMVLGDSSGEMAQGRASVERRLAAKIAVTPIGMEQPSSYLVLYENSSAHFGRTHAFRCPHQLDDARCGIWRYREAVCCTWFCKHDRGATGFTFWRDGLEELLRSVERELAKWCVLEGGIDAECVGQLLSSNEGDRRIPAGELDGEVKDAEHRRLWGKWTGKEREFYETCAAKVRDLSWANVEQICGPQTRLFARRTQEAYKQLTKLTVDESLRCGTFKVINLCSDRAFVSTYSEYDPVEIPIRLLGALQHFQGQPTTEVIAAVAARENVQLTDELVRKLADFRLLVTDGEK